MKQLAEGLQSDSIYHSLLLVAIHPFTFWFFHFKILMSKKLNFQNIYCDEEARAWIVKNLLEKDGLFKLSLEEISSICTLTEGIYPISSMELEFFFGYWLLFPSFSGYSGSDMKNLVKDASMGPLREALRQGIEIANLKKEDLRPVTLQVAFFKFPF